MEKLGDIFFYLGIFHEFPVEMLLWTYFPLKEMDYEINKAKEKKNQKWRDWSINMRTYLEDTK